MMANKNKLDSAFLKIKKIITRLLCKIITSFKFVTNWPNISFNLNRAKSCYLTFHIPNNELSKIRRAHKLFFLTPFADATVLWAMDDGCIDESNECNIMF